MRDEGKLEDGDDDIIEEESKEPTPKKPKWSAPTVKGKRLKAMTGVSSQFTKKA